MKESTTKFPLGEWLLLALLASKLNNKNLNALDQLLKNMPPSVKKSPWWRTPISKMLTKSFLTFKEEITQWTLQKVLMQLACLEQEECSFFHAINCHQAGGGITIASLPNAAPHGCNAVRDLLPFTKWILELMLVPIQAQTVMIAFTPETIAQQATWHWGPINFCILQVDSYLIGWALNNFLIYNLTTTNKPPTTITTNNAISQNMTYTSGVAVASANTTVYNTNNSDSISNTMLSHRTWFTTTTTHC